MSLPDLKQYGFYAIRDSGPPVGQKDYTTLIIFHGLAFNSAIFAKLFPFADRLKIRLVAVNRRGYSGAAPLSEAECQHLADISAIKDPDLAAARFLEHIKESGKLTYDFLTQFVSEENITRSCSVIVAGWSLGGLTVLGLLAYASQSLLSSKYCDRLRSYIKHMVIYDIPAAVLGYNLPPNLTNPWTDPLLALEDISKIFPLWASGYYDHGKDFRHPKCRHTDVVSSPSPTLASFSSLDMQSCMEMEPMVPGGYDERVFALGVTLGVFARLKDIVLLRCGGSEVKHGTQRPDRWDDVVIKHIWCDQAPFEMPWAAISLRKELEDNIKRNTRGARGRMARKVEFLRLRGANHFCHWDNPELALQALLSDVEFATPLKDLHHEYRL